MVKMSAALLLLMNSLCQMLDTACVSRVLFFKNGICMTKADGFRVLRREGWVGGGLKGSRRQEAGDRLRLLDRRTGIAGSLPVRTPDTLLDMLDIEAEILDEESAPDLGLNVPHMEFVHRLLRGFLLLWRKMGILQLRVQQ